ncbi:unnamed protein product [Rotaria socialis]|uniref:Uncharacterized protein n=1 Tax=Rotaria socialis TaxID=392032 RepID=A0A821DU09_9BILA|nr:unnamed protein product [Rotaria socialis]CAF4484682.1 unnamed protein product [Rotaria socialis]CAF4626450.1 unnamed protein product [Rotaria socialis]CAF4805357.1 unnamed protein product [Rotaria socialis]CAF4857033.1 unnamed protein product [Rotaria socialis]
MMMVDRLEKAYFKNLDVVELMDETNRALVNVLKKSSKFESFQNKNIEPDIFKLIYCRVEAIRGTGPSDPGRCPKIRLKEPGPNETSAGFQTDENHEIAAAMAHHPFQSLQRTGKK